MWELHEINIYYLLMHMWHPLYISIYLILEYETVEVQEYYINNVTIVLYRWILIRKFGNLCHYIEVVVLSSVILKR
jgi:hypothetical protein